MHHLPGADFLISRSNNPAADDKFILAQKDSNRDLRFEVFVTDICSSDNYAKPRNVTREKYLSALNYIVVVGNS